MFQWTLMLSGHNSSSSCHVSMDSYVIRSQQQLLLSCFNGLLCYQVIAAHIPLVMFQWTLMLSGHSSTHSSCHVSMDSYVIRSQQHTFLLSCFNGLLYYQVIAAHSSCHVSLDSYVIRSQQHTFLLSCFNGLLCYQVIAAHIPLVMFHWTLMLSGHNSSSSCHVSMDSYVIRSQQHTFLFSCFTGLLCYQVIAAHIPLLMFHWTVMLSGHSSAFLLSCFTGLLCYQVIAAAPLVMFQWTFMLSGYSSTFILSCFTGLLCYQVIAAHSSCHVSMDSYVIRSQQRIPLVMFQWTLMLSGHSSTFLLSCFTGLLCYKVIAAHSSCHVSMDSYVIRSQQHIPLVMFHWTLMLSGHSSAFLLSCFTGLLCYQVIAAHSSCHVSLDSYVIRSQQHIPLVMFHWTLMLSGHSSTLLLSCFTGLLCYQVIAAHSSCHVSLDSYVIRSQQRIPLVMFHWTLML